MITRFLNSQTKTVSFASLILMGSYLASATLGLVRDRLLAGKFGAGSELDAYYAAFVVPDFIALILIFGAISAAVIPIFNFYSVKSEEEAWHYLSAFFNVFLGFLILICLILIAFAPYLVSFIAPGFSQEKKEITAQLMRIMFLSPVLLGTSNIISGVLQIFHKFLVTALAPIMYNFGIIFGILFFVPKFDLIGLALGVVLGAVLHLLIQIPAFFSSGFHYRLNFNIGHPGVLKTLKLMAPRSLGLGASQLNTVIITVIGSTLSAGSIAVFNLANNLASILVNAVSASLSTAIFPKMTLAYLKEDKREFELKFAKALRQILFLTIPLSLLIFILRAQIVRIVLGWGKFGWLDTRLTAACLGIFALSLFAHGLIFIVSKTFYAAHNTKIPAIISCISVAFNIFLAFFFVWLLSSKGIFYHFMQELLRLKGIENISVVGLVLAYSLASVLQIILLLYFLYKKYKIFRLKEVSNSLNNIIPATIIMAVITFFTRHYLAELQFVALQTSLGVLLQLIISGIIGAVVYIAISHLLKSEELAMIKNSFFNGSQISSVDRIDKK